MAGNFVTSRYQASYDSTQIFKIRVQPETLTALAGTTANAAPTADVNQVLHARVSGGIRRLGLHARILYLVLPSGSTPPVGYSTNARTVIPALTPAFYNAAITAGAVFYLGVGWNATSRPERLR